MNFPYHPAPGLGELLPGFFVVPQNPIQPDTTLLVPSLQATAPNQVLRIPKLGDLIAASFVVPQNPLLPGTNPTSLAGLGCGCGCENSNFYGLGDLNSTVASAQTWLSAPSPISAIPNWALYGGLAVGAYLIMAPGGSEYRSKKRALAGQYRGYRRAAGYASQRLAEVS